MSKITTRGISLLTILALGSTMIAGCSNNNVTVSNAENAQSSSSQSAEKNSVTDADKAEVTDFIQDYYKNTYAKSSIAWATAQNIESSLRNALGDTAYLKVSSGFSSYDDFNKLTDQENKKLADTMESLNPMASYFDFSGMKDSEKTYVNMTSIFMSAMLSGRTFKSVDVPTDKLIMPDSTHASIQYSNISITDTDTTYSAETASGLSLSTLYMVKVGNEWKISGKDFFNEIQTIMQSSQSGAESGN